MPPNPTLKRIAFNRVLIAILVMNFLSRLILTLKPLPYLDGKMISDDAYLSLHIARSIGEGKGPWYDELHTNGFQPLYVFMMAPVYTLSTDQVEGPVTIALILLSLFDTATLALLLLWIKEMTTANIAFLTSVFWIFNEYIIQTTLNGLETIMATFFIVAASYYFYKLYYQRTSHTSYALIPLGILCGLACLTRVDALLFALVIGVLTIVHEFRNKELMIFRAGVYGLSTLAVFSIWIGYSLYYTGMWYPESGKAVRLISLTHSNFNTDHSFFLKMFRQAAVVTWKMNAFLIVTTTLLLAYAFKKRLFRLSQFKATLSLVLFCVAIFFAYTCYVFADWYFHRYFFPFIIVFIIIFALSANTVLHTLSSFRVRLGVACILLLWLGLIISRGNFADLYAGPPDNNMGYRNIAIWANENLPENTVVGCSQSGALGYFCTKLKVVNLDGVVNGQCYEYLLAEKNMEYIRKREIEYILGWPVNMDFIRLRSKDYTDSDITHIKKIESFKSWYHEWSLYQVNHSMSAKNGME